MYQDAPRYEGYSDSAWSLVNGLLRTLKKEATLLKALCLECTPETSSERIQLIKSKSECRVKLLKLTSVLRTLCTDDDFGRSIISLTIWFDDNMKILVDKNEARARAEEASQHMMTVAANLLEIWDAVPDEQRI